MKRWYLDEEFIYDENSDGPKTLPWGVPCSSSAKSDFHTGSLRTVFCWTDMMIKYLCTLQNFL